MLPVFAGGCADRLADKRAAIAELIGKEVVIPENIIYRVQDIPIDNPLENADYRIVTYIDSTGCTSCRMKLNTWREIIGGFKSMENEDVEFMMILGSEPTKVLNFYLKSDSFLSPVAFDPNNLFPAANNLPEDDAFRTLLLDRDNRVIAIGNPATNPKVYDLYRRIISGEESFNSHADDSPLALELCIRPSVGIGVVHPEDTVSHTFELYNSGDTPLTVQGLIPSCDCTSTSISADTIAAGGKALLTMTLTADTVNGSFSRHIDLYFHEIESPRRFTLYGFIQK